MSLVDNERLVVFTDSLLEVVGSATLLLETVFDELVLVQDQGF